MNILVLVATHEEFKPYLLIPNYHVLAYEGEYKAIVIQYGDFKLLVVETGMGKVNAAIAITRTLATSHWDVVINAGMCGSLIQAAPGTLYYGTAFIEHDFDLSPIGIERYAITQLSRDSGLVNVLKLVDPQVLPALVITGDQFLTEFSEELLNKGALVCDMEAISIVKAINSCNSQYNTETQGLVLKMVSDGGSGDDYKNNQEALCAELAAFVFKLCDLVCLGNLSHGETIDFNPSVQPSEKEV